MCLFVLVNDNNITANISFLAAHFEVEKWAICQYFDFFYELKSKSLLRLKNTALHNTAINTWRY